MFLSKVNYSNSIKKTKNEKIKYIKKVWKTNMNLSFQPAA
jgi:hypothetical protein